MLKLESLNQEQTSYWIVDDEFVVGSAKKNQLCIESDTIEEEHAICYVDGNKLYVEPKSNKALIRINTIRISVKTLLNINDTVEFATTKFKLTNPSDRKVELPRFNTDALDNNVSTPSIIWKVQGVNQVNENIVVLIDKNIKIGRDATNDLALSGNHVSRKHAELYVKNDQLILKDLNSANGTYVNGEKITERAVYLGDLLKFDTDIFKVIAGKPASLQDELLNDKTQFRPAITKEQLKQSHQTPSTKPTVAADTNLNKEEVNELQDLSSKQTDLKLSGFKKKKVIRNRTKRHITFLLFLLIVVIIIYVSHFFQYL